METASTRSSPTLRTRVSANVRIIDATEIQDIYTNPDDATEPWYYLRQWTQKVRDPSTGTVRTEAKKAWYPAINYTPDLDKIGDVDVMKDTPVYHRKVGAVGGWLFGCPPMYPMLDWAKEQRHYLEACASDAQSRAQFSRTIETKGGQQAIEGIKQQIETQVGPSAPIWDTNPPAVAGASWISGPGTVMKSINTAGGLDPEKCRQFKLQCCMVFGLPETFLGDVSTGNLATATSLDRPTETMFLAIQREWIEEHHGDCGIRPRYRDEGAQWKAAGVVQGKDDQASTACNPGKRTQCFRGEEARQP